MASVSSKIKGLPVQVKASMLFFIALVIQKFSGALTLMFFTRIMSSADYGRFSIFNSWLSVWSIVITMSLSAGIYMQGLVKFEKDRNKFEVSIQSLSFFLCLIWLLVYLGLKDIINSWFGFSTVQMIMAFSIIWTNAVFDFWSSGKRVEYKCIGIVVVSLIVSITRPIASYFFIQILQDKVTGWIMGICVVNLVVFLHLFIATAKKGEFSVKYWKYAINYSIPLIPHYLSQTILNSSDRIMIGKMVGESEAGIYNLAYSIAMVLTMMSKAIVSVLNPWIYKKIKAKKIDEIAEVGYLALGIVAALNIILVALAPEIIAVIAPSVYSSAVWVIPPIAVGSFFMFSYDLFSEFAFYYNKTTMIMGASVCGAVLNIILNVYFIRIWGFYAAGYTTMVCFFLYALIHYCVMNSISHKYIQEQSVYNWKILCLITVLFVAVCSIYLIGYRHIWLRITMSLAILVVCVLKGKRITNYIRSLVKANG